MAATALHANLTRAKASKSTWGNNYGTPLPPLGTIGVAHRAVGATLLYGGFFHEAEHQFDEVTSLLASTDDPEFARRFNGGPRAAAHILRAISAWLTSDFDAAARVAQEAAAEAERADDADQDARTTPIESPQSNGMAEAFVRGVKRPARGTDTGAVQCDSPIAYINNLQ